MIKQYRCENCGSTDVEHDAIMEWDYEKQEIVVLSILDTKTCTNCGSKNISSIAVRA